MKKITVALTIALVALLLLATMTLAYYSNVIGELRNSKDNALWTHGADVEVFNCSSMTTIATQTVGSSGTFDIDISSISSDTPLCIEVTFHAGPAGTPGNAAKGTFVDRANSGTPPADPTLNTGVYLTGTGPNAVTLTNITARSANTWLPVGLVVGFSVLALGALFVLRKRRALS